MLTRIWKAALLLCLLAGLPACRQSGGDAQSGHGHHHEPPHGGTAIILGNEDHHLELVLNAAEGKLDLYVLDGHMEQFIRIQQERLVLEIKEPEAKLLHLFPVEDRATGETFQSTSRFTVADEWLKRHSRFRGELKEIQIRGKQYRSVSIRFPEGNVKPH
jgi:hypothetical protein